MTGGRRIVGIDKSVNAREWEVGRRAGGRVRRTQLLRLPLSTFKFDGPQLIPDIHLRHCIELSFDMKYLVPLCSVPRGPPGRCLDNDGPGCPILNINSVILRGASSPRN